MTCNVYFLFQVYKHERANVNYRDGNCAQNTIEKHASRIRGRQGVVIGTQNPWLEAVVLGIISIAVVYVVRN